MTLLLLRLDSHIYAYRTREKKVVFTSGWKWLVTKKSLIKLLASPNLKTGTYNYSQAPVLCHLILRLQLLLPRWAAYPHFAQILMGKASVQCEHHDKHQNKHRQADHGDDLLQGGQPSIAC